MSKEILRKIYRYNRYFKKQHERIFNIQTGDIPVIVSAPHAVPVLKKSYQKPGESFTGALAMYFNDVLNVHSIYSLNLGRRDPNRDRKCIYKKTLLDHTLQHNIKYVIDLHGATNSHGFAVDLGTNLSQSIDPELVADIIHALNYFKVTPVTENSVFKATRSSVITNYISTLGSDVQAIQLEISKDYRDPFNQPEKFLNLIDALQTIILIMERAANAKSRANYQIN